MVQKSAHQCDCKDCQEEGDSPTKKHHQHINLFMSRLDEQQRRWYVAVESEKRGYGGDAALSRITGMNSETIRRGRSELAEQLAERPIERIRLVGGGRHRVEKKVPTSK